MPITAPKTYIKQAWNVPGDNAAMAYDMVKWLTDEHSSITGPAWTVVTADDGSRIDQPAGGDFLANIDSGNDWSTGNANTPLLNTWVCLESLDASTNNGTNHFQLIIRAVTNNIEFYLIPYENFSIPGATTSFSAPTVPANSVGYDLPANINFNTSWLNMCADEGMLAGFLDEQAGSYGRFFYVGELDDGHPSDDRPYALFNDINYGAIATGDQWTMIAAQDGTTVLDNGYTIRFGGSSVPLNTATRMNLLGVDPLFRLGASAWSNVSGSSPSGLIQFRGWCRNIREAHESLADHGTLDNLNWLYVNSSAGTRSTFAIASDGVTTYP